MLPSPLVVMRNSDCWSESEIESRFLYTEFVPFCRISEIVWIMWSSETNVVWE